MSLNYDASILTEIVFVCLSENKVHENLITAILIDKKLSCMGTYAIQLVAITEP